MTAKYRLYVQKGRGSGKHRVATWRVIRPRPYEEHFMRQNGMRYADACYLSIDIGMSFVTFFACTRRFL